MIRTKVLGLSRSPFYTPCPHCVTLIHICWCCEGLINHIKGCMYILIDFMILCKLNQVDRISSLGQALISDTHSNLRHRFIWSYDPCLSTRHDCSQILQSKSCINGSLTCPVFGFYCSLFRLQRPDCLLLDWSCFNFSHFFFFYKNEVFSFLFHKYDMYMYLHFIFVNDDMFTIYWSEWRTPHPSASIHIIDHVHI